MAMNTESAHTAIRMVGLALDTVQRSSGSLPTYDDPDPADGEPPQTFLELVKQFAGDLAAEADLVAAIDAISPLFSAYQFPWK